MMTSSYHFYAALLCCSKFENEQEFFFFFCLKQINQSCYADVILRPNKRNFDSQSFINDCRHQIFINDEC
jgi:hypothetical protein